MRKLATIAAMTLSAGSVVFGGASAAHAGINIGDNWCAAPWSWPGPVSNNVAPFSYDACNNQTNGESLIGGGTNIADNWCAAPWMWEGPLSDNAAAFTYKACDNQRNDSM